MKELKYKRVLLKVSGEALMGDQGYGIDMSVVSRFSHEGLAADLRILP